MKKKKILLFFACVIASSAVLSALIMFAANDALALNKSYKEATVVLSEESNAGTLAKKLYGGGIIDFPIAFRLYSSLRHKDKFPAGEYVLTRDMSYDDIYIALSGKKEREQIKVTIPEGKTTDEIIELFVSAGIGTRDGFVSALGDDYGYDYIPNKTAARTYRYDGYLFPDTYFFYSDASERDVIAKMLFCFDKKFTPSLRALAEKNKISVDDCVTLASIIQREAYYVAEMRALSSVIFNRLKSRTLRRLECDSTVAYAWQMGDFEGAFLSADSPYNTYKYEGLPPGAICSPGLSALEAAADPKKTDYYYFFSKNDKTFVFSKTYAEHIAQRRKYGV